MNLQQMKNELIPIVTRMPSYLKLAIALYKEPELSKGRKVVLATGLLYTVSPIDLVPGFIPVAGQLDDILVGLGTLRSTMRTLSPDLLAFYEERFGVTMYDIEQDIQSAKKVSLYLIKKTVEYSAKGILKVGKTGISYLTKLALKNQPQRARRLPEDTWGYAENAEKKMKNE